MRDEIGVGVEAAELITGRGAQHMVRVHDQDVVGFSPSERDRFASIGAEIAPRSFVQLTRNVAQMRSNDLLRSIVRAGIDDRPVSNVGTDGIETTAYHMRLVLHDHVEAERRGHRLGGICCIAECAAQFSGIFESDRVRAL